MDNQKRKCLPDVHHFRLSSSLTFADDDLFVGIDRQESVVRTQELFSVLKKLEIKIF
jgi:hypothetical protein